VTLVAARWFSSLGALTVGLVFALHPVHVEGVANLVSRAELLAALGVLAAVLCARRGLWVAAVVAAAFAMLSKEHGVIAAVAILADDWLGRREGKPAYPRALYVALGLVTLAYAAVWWQVGRHSGIDQAPAFFGVGAGARLATALPAVWRAATVLVWPFDLVVDYGPQVLPVRSGFSLPAAGGLLVIAAVLCVLYWSSRRHRGVCLLSLIGVLAFLPTSNLLFSVGVVLAERTLYLPVIIVAALAGLMVAAVERRRVQRAVLVLGMLVLALGWRSWTRIPVWGSNRLLVLATLFEHPESYRAHVWAASLLAGMRDTAGARREYQRAEALFDRDPHLDAAHGYYLMTLGDTAAARPRIARARGAMPDEPFALRAAFMLLLARRDTAGARALADTALAWSRVDASFYQSALQPGGSP
jgi:hypothetical protein